MHLSIHHLQSKQKQDKTPQEITWLKGSTGVIATRPDLNRDKSPSGRKLVQGQRGEGREGGWALTVLASLMAMEEKPGS